MKARWGDDETIDAPHIDAIAHLPSTVFDSANLRVLEEDVPPAASGLGRDGLRQITVLGFQLAKACLAIGASAARNVPASKPMAALST